MSDKTIRIFPLEGFECTVTEFYELVGKSGQPEHAPFPHDEGGISIVPCAGDWLRYGPALFVEKRLMRVVTYRIEDSDEEHTCLAVYGRLAGPRRMLRNGSWSQRVVPFSCGEWCGMADELEEFARMSGLSRTNDWRRREIVLLVRGEGDQDYWANTDTASVHAHPECDA